MSEIKDKILMIAATPFFSDRGCHIRIYNEIKYLKKEGINVVLCTYHLGNNINGLEIKRIPNVSWYKKITPGASWGKMYLDFLLLILSYKEYRRNRPKIIHAHLYEGLLIAWLIKLFSFSNVKIVFDCQGSLAEEMRAYTLNKSIVFKPFYYLFVLIEKISLKMPDKILCSSKNSYDFIRNKYKISQEKIDILNDGVDTDLFQPASKEEKIAFREKFNIPKENKIVVYAGSICQAKGVDDLLEVIPKILEKNKKITFTFVGYGDLENIYKEKYKNYIESSNVVFFGRIAYFELSKYVAPSNYVIDTKKNSSESSSKIFNTAGLPVICFNNEFNFSVLGDSGLYINKFEDIAEKVNSNVSIIEYKNLPYWSENVKKLVSVYAELK